MQTRLPQTEDNGPWSDESNTEIMFDFTSEESLCTDSSEILTLEVLEPSKDHLDEALELNRQLHASLQRKQKEISALKEKNAQLKELAKQAEQYATILDVLIPQPVKGCVSHPASSTEPSEWHFTAPEGSWLPSVPINTEQQACSQTHGAKRQLWPTDHNGYSNNSDHEVYSRSSGQEPYLRSSDHDVYSRSSDHEICSRGSGQEPYSRSSDHEVYSRSSDHEICSRGSGQEPYVRSSDHDVYSRSSDHEVYSRSSDYEICSRGSGQEPYSRSSDHEVYSRSSDHEICSRGSGQEPYSRSSDHEPNSKSSDPKLFSKSSCHESYSKSSDAEVYLRNSDHKLYSQSSGHASYSSSDHEPYSKTADHNLYSQSYDHEVYSNSVNSSAVEYSVNGENPDPKRLKLDHYPLQLDYKDLTSQTEQVYLKSTEDSPSNKTNHCTLNTEMIQVYGSFHGLKVVMARCSDLSEHGKEELVCFKTSIREHSTVRTNVFPHGKTFTSRTPDGSCRFLWVPNQN
ncbi:multicilin [Pygocentrus nattereri]|uniref:multicilin n=1 Tax=Pygocentrus nattereri TaxID=42514 RepID=UPI0008146D3A|nr:multicilin [Pygocentrus nattereri]